MTDFTQVIRWNANFVRGLAESVLNRARVIRGSLATTSTTPEPVKKRASAAPKRKRVRRRTKR